jgi:membrane-bound serine protease (ClpP class)
LYNELEEIMDFLLNPNIAYLFVLGGVFFAMLALVTPGTGLLELTSLLFLVLGGYGVYNLSFNWWALVLIILSVVPFFYSIQKPKREIFLGLSIALLVIGSIFLFPSERGGPAVNPLLAIVASALVAGFLWLAARKSLQAAQVRPVHDLNALIGQVGEAKTNVSDDGSVQVAGELWTARSDKSIKAGSSIRVLGRDGFVLIVEKVDS